MGRRLAPAAGWHRPRHRPYTGHHRFPRRHARHSQHFAPRPAVCRAVAATRPLLGVSLSQAGPWTLLAAPPAAVALLALTALIGGRTITRPLPSRGRLEQALVALAAGLLLLAEIGLVLGCGGRLAVVPLLAALGAVHLAGIAAWRWLLDGLRTTAARLRAPAAGRLAVAGCGAVAAALLPVGMLAIYPPTGFDATLYHLPFAKAFAVSGGLPFLPDLRVPVFPQLNEMLLAMALLLGGDAAAQLLMALATALTAALLLLWGREAFPEAPGAGWIAAAAWLGNPLVVYLGGSAYVDPALALWVTAALYAVHRYRAGGGTGWLAASAAAAGAAAAGKYLGLFFVAAIAAIVAAGARNRLAVQAAGSGDSPVRRASPRRGHAALFMLVALAVMAPWYGRILYYTGNPLFPFFPRLFGGSPWDPLDVGPAGPWWRSASALPPLSPVYLAALPLVAWRAARDAHTRRLLLLVAAFAGVTLALPRDPRYLLPVVPVASLALGVTLASWGPPFPRLRGRRRLAAASAALLLPGWLYGVIRIVHLGPPPPSQASREALLARELPLYPAVRFLNRHAGSAYTAFGFGTENLHYFADGRLLGDWAGPASYRRMPSPAGDPRALEGALRRLGADYLILPASYCRAGRTEGADFRRGFRLLYADLHARAFALGDLAPSAALPAPPVLAKAKASPR
jgi:hypothetical protein